MMRSLVFSIASMIVCVQLSCSDDSRVCDPGATRACTCTSGGNGSQVCDPVGARWESCICDKPGTDGAATSDSGVHADTTSGGPDSKTTSPDSKTTSPDSKTTSPDSKTTSPDSKVCVPTGSKCTVSGDCCGSASGTSRCVDFGASYGTICADSCVSSSNCVSGCCAPLSSGGSTCAPAVFCNSCTNGQYKCTGSSGASYLQQCVGTSWVSESCWDICLTGGYGGPDSCGYDAAKGHDVCFCSMFGASCTSTCQSGYSCMKSSTGTQLFCTKPCSGPSDTSCTLNAPAGTLASCHMQASSGAYYCGFICESGGTIYSCPGKTVCSSTSTPGVKVCQ